MKKGKEGLLGQMKQAIKKSGTSKGKILYFRPGQKVRVRFLQELDDGMKMLFHDSFELGVNHPCQELYDKECVNHERDDLRHRDLFMWSVWDYESKDVKILLGAVNAYSPIPNLVSMYETYETIMDRDYVITKNGSQTSTSFAVVPLDKVRFKNEKAKAYSESKLMAIIAKAYPVDSDEDEEEDEEEENEEPKKSLKKFVKKSFNKKKKKKKPSYDEMSAKELYDECIERDIKVKPRKEEDYYIEKLEDFDLENEEEEEGEEDDEGGWN